MERRGGQLLRTRVPNPIVPVDGAQRGLSPFLPIYKRISSSRYSNDFLFAPICPASAQALYYLMHRNCKAHCSGRAYVAKAGVDRHVAWFGSASSAALHGVQQYIAEHRPWDLHYQWEYRDADWAKWEGNGIFINGDPDQFSAIARIARQAQIPIVVLNSPNDVALPCVADDHAAIGVMAAEHLLERGVTHFGHCGCCGLTGKDFSAWRHKAFVQRIQQAGFSCSDFDVSAKPHPWVVSLGQWLAAMPKPCGIMCDYYLLGSEVMAACLGRRLAVPEDVAVITVKGADEAERPARIPLSYVNLNARRAGYESAALLDRLMADEPVQAGITQWIAPLGVETRKSTDMLAIPDPHVAKALRMIWQHACDGIEVRDVLKRIPLSRRSFEQRFHKCLGRTPHEEIIRVQMNQVKSALAGTNSSLEEIARKSGYASAKSLITAFHREVGLTPGNYRSSRRLAGAAHD